MDENQNKNESLSPEIKKAIEADEATRKKLAEIFAQCWDDAEFQKRFIKDPVGVMEEYDVEFDKSKDFVILESKEKTITYVLPYDDINHTLDAIGKAFEDAATKGADSRKILPEGWSMEFIQNTIDTNYIVIPVNPEKLSPEELELVNGGSLIFCAFIFVVAAVLFAVAAAAVHSIVGAVAVVGAAFGAVYLLASVTDSSSTASSASVSASASVAAAATTATATTVA